VTLAAGRLRERITIRRQQDVPDGKGAFTRSWTTIADGIRAEVINQGGREALVANALQGISAWRIVIRKRSDLLASDQVLWNDQELNIRSVGDDPLNPRDATQIFADTGTPQGA
jgi:SPP1 family predicted phage head-tail adaptor